MFSPELAGGNGPGDSPRAYRDPRLRVGQTAIGAHARLEVTVQSRQQDVVGGLPLVSAILIARIESAGPSPRMGFSGGRATETSPSWGRGRVQRPEAGL